jgi:hypothetical protein
MTPIKSLLLALAFASSCSIIATAPSPYPATNPGGLPDLCSIDGGRWCVPCGQTGGPACPELADSGALCCSGGKCVVWNGSKCSGVLGWCSNYTTETKPSGAVEATCHDVPGGGG